jgi:succinate dehydrogenase / fumarate reductase cytochrome b subunit
MEIMQRPLSPHLQVYKPQLTSILSILHRATGVFLILGTLLFVYWLLALAAGPEAYAKAQGFFGSILGRVILFPWTFALFYHLCSGVRHLFWDAGLGFEIKSVYASGIAVVVVSLALTLVAFGAAYAMRGGGAA